MSERDQAAPASGVRRNPEEESQLVVSCPLRTFNSYVSVARDSWKMRFSQCRAAVFPTPLPPLKW
jgi:hypothetical protein